MSIPSFPKQLNKTLGCGNEFNHSIYAPITYQFGFIPNKVLTSLPTSHKLWDDMADRLPDLIGCFKVKDDLSKMPILHADESSLSDEYLTRASILVSSFAHAYYYLDGYHEKEVLPDSIEIPLKEISLRIKKLWVSDKSQIKMSNYQEPEEFYVGRTLYEDFIANWKMNCQNDDGKEILLEDIRYENLKVLVPYFRVQEEEVSTLLTGPLMQKAFIPIIQTLVSMDQLFKKDDEEKATREEILIKLLRDITRDIKSTINTFLLMSPKVGSNTHVDQVLWPKTFPTIGKKSHPREMANSGADSPTFHIMDRLIHRNLHNTRMGKHINDRFNALPTNYQNFIVKFVDPIAQKLYEIVRESDNSVKEAFAGMVLAYAGDSGLLEVHRKKAFGYLKFSFLAGRSSTNSNEKGSAHTGSQGKNNDMESQFTPWGRLNYYFSQSILERRTVLSDPIFGSCLPNMAKKTIDLQQNNKQAMEETSKFYRHEISLYNNPNSKLFAIYENRVLDLTQFVRMHPGGHKILFSSCGSDMTLITEQAHPLVSKKYTDKYCIGYVKEFSNIQSVPQMQEFVDNWTKILFTISETQNNIRCIWFYDEKSPFDNKRNVPFHFLRDHLSVMFGLNGYLDYLLSLMGNDLVKIYRLTKLESIMVDLGENRNSRKKQLYFTDIGELLKNFGILEIQMRNIDKLEETVINNLGIWELYSKIIFLTLDYLEETKRCIVHILNVQANSQNLEEVNVLEIEHHLLKLIQALTTRFTSQIDCKDNRKIIYSSVTQRIYPFREKCSAIILFTLKKINSFSHTIIKALGCTKKKNIKLGNI